MKDRLIDYPVAWVSGASASVVSVFAAAIQDQAMAVASAVVAVSVVLAQPTMKAFRSLKSAIREEGAKDREAARAEEAKDREADLAAFAAEVRKRVELEAEVAKLRAEIEALQGELSQLRKATRAVNHKVEGVKTAVERAEQARSSDSIPTHEGKAK